ncbi:MAG: transcriptional repressor, partial [Pirellulales bacterium]|nr:transcriptional repressor [Pirellulales bacterium]
CAPQEFLRFTTRGKHGKIRFIRPHIVQQYNGKTRRHHHLICTQCHRVVDFESADLDRLPLPADQFQDFDVEDYSIHVLGTCRACRKKRKP